MAYKSLNPEKKGKGNKSKDKKNPEKKGGEKKNPEKKKASEPKNIKLKFGFDWQKHLPDHKFKKSNKK